MPEMSGKEETQIPVDFKPIIPEKRPKEIDVDMVDRIEKKVTIEERSFPSSDDLAAKDPEDENENEDKQNYYVAARGHVQRVVDVALLISNMSRLATITKTSDDYTTAQFMMLAIALCLSMVAQVVAGICFFVSHQREINRQRTLPGLDYTAYGCVGAVMVLNIFISTFHATWTTASTPPVLPTVTAAPL